VRKICVWFLVSLTILTGSTLYAQEKIKITFQGSENLHYTEKANLRLRENGTYLGYLYKEVRAFFNLDKRSELTYGGNEYVYTGNVYVLEDQKRNARQAKWIDDWYELAVTASDRGEYSTDSAHPYPRTRGFPVLFTGALQEGDSWRDYGTQVILPRDGAKPTEIEFYCEYRYKGEGVYLERAVDIITAQYATRYKRGQDPDGDPDLVEATGKHLLTIYIEKAGTGWMFLRDQVDEQYKFADGSRGEIEGFYLTWYEGAIPVNKNEELERVKSALLEDGVGEVAVSETGEGVSISIRNIHFRPDQAEVLESEYGRLDSIADILKTTGEQTVKVVGHTADVGKTEGQNILSIERAKAIIDEMIKRGLPAEKFIYEGRGGSEPIASNETDEGRAANRRVEFIILGN